MNAASPMFRTLFLMLFSRFTGGRAGSAATAAHTAGVRNPKLASLMAVLSLLYLVTPVDLVPDFMPIIGWLDDGLILWFGLSQAWRAARSSNASPAQHAASTRSTAPNVIETTARVK